MSDELTNSSADDPSRWQQLSYQQFQFLTANASDVIWTTDLDLNLTFVSESVRNVRGYSPNEAISLGVGGALTEKSVEDIKALISNGLAIDATADPNRSTRLETRLSHKDGHEIDVEINVSFLRGSDSKPIGLIGITKDISDRKRLEAAMQAVIRGTDRSSGDGFLNALVKNIASVLNVRGVVVGELKGQTVETVAVCLDGDLAENFTYLLAGTPCEQVMDQSTCTYPVNVQALFPEDQMLVDMGIESYLGTPLLSSDGKVIGVLSCIDVQPMTDTQLAQSLITIFGSLAGAELDRRRSEIERELIRSQLLQAQKLESVGQLTGGIAHDFNNLLVVIQGYLELAQDSAGDDEELTEFHSHIQDAADRAAALTHKLLSFSRRQIMDTRPLDLNELVRDIGELIRRVVPEYISYELITDEDIGTVVGDPGELEQVVMNLAVNARDAMPTGGRLTIETRDRKSVV